MFGLLFQSIILCYVFILVVLLFIKFYFSYLFCCYEVCSVIVSGLIL